MPSSAMAPKHGTEANGIKASSDTCSGFLHIGRMHCEACPGDQRGNERCHEQGPPHRTIAPASPALVSHLSSSPWHGGPCLARCPALVTARSGEASGWLILVMAQECGRGRRGTSAVAACLWR